MDKIRHPKPAKDLDGAVLSGDANDVPPERRRRYRRLGRLTLGSILTAAFLELAGRMLYLIWEVPYGITGLLTLLAIGVWGMGSVYVIGQLRGLRTVSRLLLWGATLLILSQSVSLCLHFQVPVIAPVLSRVPYLEGFLEEGFFVIGLALLVSGFYLAIFEADRANARTELGRQALLQEMEQRLRVQEVLYTKSLAIDTSATALLFGDTQGRIVEVNPAFLKLWGYHRPAEVAGRLATDFWLEDRAGKRVMEQLFAQGSWTGDLIAKTHDGIVRDMHVSASVIKSRDGVLRGMMASFTDLTQYRRVELELRESRAELQAIYDSLVDGLCIAEVETGEFLHVNEAFCAMLGYSETALLSKSVQDIHPPEHLPQVWACFQALSHGAQRQAADIPCLRSNGSVFYADISALTMEYRGRSCLMGIFRDCTVRKQHEEALQRFNAELEDRVKARTAEIECATQALRERETQYRELVQSANSIILRMDREGNITFFNEFAQRFFGYEEQEVLGKNVVGTIVPQIDGNGRDMKAMILDIAVHPDQYAGHENENIRRNGERVWIAWTNTPVYNQAGEVRETLCVGNDITARVRAERLLTEQQMKMLNSARLSSLGTMASNIAHEINNPLAVMAAGAEQLSAFIAEPEKYTDKIRTITQMVQRNTSRIQRIIRGLRSLSRDASEDPFVDTPIQDIISDTIELCRERFKLHDIELRVTGITPGISIECRAAQIGQVLLNLLNNAFDVVEKRSEKWVRIDVDEDDAHVNIGITDSGPGLSQEIREKLFLPFYTTKSEQKGLGLGLSISQTIIEAHGGEITVDQNCANTRFVVHVPKKQPPSSNSGLGSSIS